jgi:hypothetical protein
MSAPDRESGTRNASHEDLPMPGWVKAFVWVAALLILVFVVSHLRGGGMSRHMPQPHAPEPAAGATTAP